MTGHLDEGQLNDCVDDTLDAGDQDVRAHLGSCPACRDAVERLRLLRSDLAELPRSIQPPAHVLMGVRAGLAGTPVRPAERTWYMRPRLLAAAAVLLVAISSATTALLVRQVADPGGATPLPPSLGGSSSSLVAVHALERSYEEEVAEVQRALRGQQSALSPETLRVLQTNLDIIDRALLEARAALRADPGNDALTDLVRSGYERKLDVLRSVSSHGRGSS